MAKDYGDQKIKIARGLKENIPDLDTGELGLATDTNELLVGNDGINLNMKEYVSVKDFGAVGDGETDDSEAIQKAVDYVKNSDKKAIFFPSGSYYITEKIVLNSDCRIIKGSNAEEVTILSNKDITLIEVEHQNDPLDGGFVRGYINNLTLKNNNEDNNGIGIDGTRLRYSYIENIVCNNLNIGIKLDRSWGTQINKSNISYNNINIDFGGEGNGIVVNQCRLDRSNDVSLKFSKAINASVLNSIIEGNKKGVEFTGSARPITFSNCYFENNDVHIECKPKSGIDNFNVKFINNNFHRIKDYLLKFTEGGTGSPFHVSFINNSFSSEVEGNYIFYLWDEVNDDKIDTIRFKWLNNTIIATTNFPLYFIDFFDRENGHLPDFKAKECYTDIKLVKLNDNLKDEWEVVEDINIYLINDYDNEANFKMTGVIKHNTSGTNDNRILTEIPSYISINSGTKILKGTAIIYDNSTDENILTKTCHLRYDDQIRLNASSSDYDNKNVNLNNLLWK